MRAISKQNSQAIAPGDRETRVVMLAWQYRHWMKTGADLGLSLRCLGKAGTAGDIGSRQAVAAGTAAEVGTARVLVTEEVLPLLRWRVGGACIVCARLVD